MADSLISLSDDKLSTRNISSAVKSLKKAKETLDKISTDTADSGSTEDCDGVKIFLCVSGDFETVRANAEKLQAILEDCESILKSGPESLRETDKSFKGQFDPDANGKWKDIRNRILNAAIAYVFPAYAAYKGLQGLFSSKSQKTQVETISVPVEPIIPTEESAPIVKSIEDRIVPFTDWKEGTKGEIRYVSQNPNNGGTKEAWGDFLHSRASSECGYASQSMAASYIGIDLKPGDLCYKEYTLEDGTHTYYGNGANYGKAFRTEQVSTSVEDIRSRTEQFMLDAGEGNTSPVVLHYGNGIYDTYYDKNGQPYTIEHQHTIVVTEYNSNDNVFTIVDPWQNGQGAAIHKIRILENGRMEQVDAEYMPHMNGTPKVAIGCQYFTP